ncbi:Protocatechuate 3,4-dioxygenase beta subunit [Nocardioides exalbidus]|uniref:Protocatechuate 3,4-dioxygenase beta subunit n=1 Tax=Nocardioides exalbidus TaxID=402596 RepID=A0A1H4VTB9_9ACTN|nr:intradiol ring-cleavage dioxygenase [Nocardioides exalbidus]SEC83524.1 Protocatechuate 3,4-dioxygenase beta subunit [Nocardioides exalbidus]
MTAHHAHDHSHGDDEVHEHDLGLQHDLGTLRRRGFSTMGRRGVLGVLGGLGVVAVAGCASDDSSASTATSSSTPSGSPPSGGPGGGAPDGGMGGDSSVEVADGEIPEETAGPYPGDGSNGPDVLSESGVVRSDITTSFGSASGVAEGVPLTLRFKLYDLTGDEVEVLSGAAIYAWHCDRDGSYSMYDGDAADENYLRGVQETDADGWVEFTSIFPACYSGRWPHVHFEVYESLDAATSVSNKLRTSQLAFPEDVCNEVYATEGYESSVTNLAQVSLDSDGIFSDGYSLQMATMKGSNDEGWTATLNVPI